MSKKKLIVPKKKKSQPSGFGQGLIVIFLLFGLFAVISEKNNGLIQHQRMISEKELKEKLALEPSIEQLKLASSKKVDQNEMLCLAKNIFFEARGTDDLERIRVINVTTNRVNSDTFPDTYCKVVYAPSQFSWTLNLVKHNVWKIVKQHTIEHKSWEHAKAMAHYELAHGYRDLTQGALFYHTHDVTPRWIRDERMVQVVNSNFHKYYSLTR